MKIIVSIAIACLAESVFEFVSDYTRDPAWRAGVIAMSQTPTGRPQLGIQTLEVARFFGRNMTTPAEVTKYEPGREIDFTGVMNASGSADIAQSVYTLQRTNKAILGFSIGSLSTQDPRRLRAITLRALQYLERGHVRIDITGVLPLRLASEAHRRIESRRNLGKLLLSVRDSC